MYKILLLCLLTLSMVMAQNLNEKLIVNSGGELVAAEFKSNHSGGVFLQVGENTNIKENGAKKGGVYSKYQFDLVSEVVNIHSLKGALNVYSPTTSANINMFNSKGNKWQMGVGETGYYLYDITNKKYGLFVHNDNNIGIGTTTPTSKLHIKGGHLTMEGTESSANIDLRHRNGNRWQLGVGQQGSYLYGAIQDAGFYSFFAHNNGNLGIATIHPKAKLHVEGDFKVTNGSHNRLIIDQDGWIGMNTVPEPGYTLTINGHAKINNNLTANNLTVSGPIHTNLHDIYFTSDDLHGVGTNKFQIAGSPVLFGHKGGGLGSTNGGNKLALQWNDQQQVGINTVPQPGYTLTANGATKIITYAPTGIGVQFGHENGNAPFISNLGGDYGLNIVTNGKKRIHVATDGYVYFHSNIYTGGDAKIEGTIKAKEIEVTLEGWSDFVFKEDYKLLPLDQLEQVIKEQQHLPDIPSEKEVLEKGVSVGKMQSKLLQKIEELTLYTIGQDKQINQQQKYIHNLENEVSELRSMKAEIEEIKKMLQNK